MNFSNFMEQTLLGATLLGSTYTSPNTVYVALCTTIASDGDFFTEVATNTAYTRVQAQFSQPTSGPTWTCVNSNSTNFGTSTTPWGIVVGFGIYDSEAIGSGNLLYWGTLGTAENIGTGNSLTLLAGDLTVRLS